MSKKDKKDKKQKSDFLTQAAGEEQEAGEGYTQNIPDDEIWTYQIEGLQAPHINKPFKNAKVKKIGIVIALVISISLAIFFSVRAVHSDLYRYTELPDGTYRLDKFSNDGSISDITVDYFVDIKTGEKDYSKPITEIAAFAFNGDEQLRTITIGKDVKSIDGKSIYSCWYIQNVFVDDANEYLCDIDGVLYNKDVTEVIHYPNDHDRYLRLSNGYAELDKDGVQHSKLVDDSGNEMEELWGTTLKYDEFYFQTYNKEVRTYVIPSTVTKIGELAFAYSNIVDLYIPEGVKIMDNMAIFKNTVLVNIYSYKANSAVTDTSYKGIDSMSEVYASLPEGLEFIGSDCMYYLRGVEYMYIPSSVTEIKHHAFWDACLKDKATDTLSGIGLINVAADEETFTNNCTTGSQWRPQYDYMLFKKSVDLNYGAVRESTKAYNVHRQYYWFVQWVINNPCSVKADGTRRSNQEKDTMMAKCSYLVKDLNNDGMPELVIRWFDEAANQNIEKIVTFDQYGYMAEFNGKAQLNDSEFSKLDNNAQLDSIFDLVK